MTERERAWLESAYRTNFKRLTARVEQVTAQAKAKPKNKALARKRDRLLREWDSMRSEWFAFDSYNRATDD